MASDQRLRDMLYVQQKALNALDCLDKAMIELSYDDLPPLYLEAKGLIEQAQVSVRMAVNRLHQELYPPAPLDGGSEAVPGAEPGGEG